MSKEEQLEEYSDYNTVQKRAKKLKLNKILVSTRKDKKYMVQNDDGKYIHFGAWGYTDATRHMDQKRIDNFKKRNHKWANADKYTPAYLSYYLLW